MRKKKKYVRKRQCVDMGLYTLKVSVCRMQELLSVLKELGF